MNHPCCIVVPCYNESERFQSDSFKVALSKYPFLHLILVNDGSKDNTHEVLVNFHQGLSPDIKNRCTVISYVQNKGKSGAIQTGLKSTLPNHHIDSSLIGAGEIPQKTFTYFGFWDADLATSFDELPWFFHFTENQEYSMMMGSRIARLGAEINRTLFRHYSGRLFATFISQGLGWKVHDTQCGAKLFTAQVAELIIEKPFITTWLFDVEILLRMRNNMGSTIKKSIIEIPLRSWVDVKGSKIGLKDFVKVPFQIWKVFSFYKK